MNNDVVIYQSSDGLVKMEAIVDASNETIWATQKAIGHLLGVDRSVITRHLSNILKRRNWTKKWFVQNLHRPLHMAQWKVNFKQEMCNSII